MPRSVLMGRVPAEGERSFTEADELDLRALWEQRRGRCPECGTEVAKWIDPVTGKELRDPPAEAKAFHCGGCETIEDWYVEHKDRRRGTRPYLDYSDASEPAGDDRSEVRP